MTKPQKELRQLLTMIRDCHAGNMQRSKEFSEWVYAGPADMLLREARFYKPSAEPVRWKHSEKQACFKNAAAYAILHGLRYVEGYACNLIPVHHGWCADADDNVIEVTWDRVGSLYYGMQFKPLQVQHGSVLFNENAPEGIYKRRYKQPRNGLTL